MEKTVDMKAAKVPKMVAGMYKLSEKIGGGSFGEIYKAINICTGQEVAVKLVPFVVLTVI